MTTIRLDGDKELARHLRLLVATSGQIRREVHTAWAEDVADDADRLVPVDTLRLADAIETRVETSEAQVGVWDPLAYYAEFVELGTSSMAEQPFLFPAYLANVDIRGYVRDALQKRLPF